VTVQLRVRGEPESGEEVTVIGNPGLGQTVLRDTLTVGVVSHPRRMLAAMPYVQTSAAVNPGNSGGPMFDSRGQVIGVVVLKAHIQAAAFAVPVETILDFLRAGRGAGQKPPSAPLAVRRWTDTTGKFSVEAELVGVKDGNVTLKRESGQVVTVPLERLCQKDRDYLRRQAAVLPR